MQIYTIGHSTHPVEVFIDMLKKYDIKQVVDIRTIPRSRHNPQYEEKSLQRFLAQHHIKYLWLEKLGGLRPTTNKSINKAWHNKSFRGYADYMQTESFTKGIDKLIRLAEDHITAIMCAEAVPWRCHRSLVGDALHVRGVGVVDIINRKNARPHTLTPFARVNGLEITYPAED